MRMEHTQEPWRYSKDKDTRGLSGWRIDSNEYSLIAWMSFATEAQRDAEEWKPRRACASVNACTGIPTEALESGVVAEMREALTILLSDMEEEYRDKRGDTDHDGIDFARAVLAKLTPQ